MADGLVTAVKATATAAGAAPVITDAGFTIAANPARANATFEYGTTGFWAGVNPAASTHVSGMVAPAVSADFNALIVAPALAAAAELIVPILTPFDGLVNALVCTGTARAENPLVVPWKSTHITTAAVIYTVETDQGSAFPDVGALDPTEIKDYLFDWSNILASMADTIASATLQYNGCTLQHASKDTLGVAAWVTAGVLGAKAGITCNIVTTAGRALSQSIAFEVRDL